MLLCFFFQGESGNRIFAPYSIFKGKAALSAEPVLPKFAKLEVRSLYNHLGMMILFFSMNLDDIVNTFSLQSGNMKVERRGVIMLTFRPAIGERKYDSEKRQVLLCLLIVLQFC